MDRSPLRYARASDGVTVAYWSYGQGPILIEGPLLPFSHIEAEWQNPHVREWYEQIGRSVTLVRYDGRGTGLSQRDAEDMSLGGHVKDLEAIVSQFDEQVALLGVFHSGPPAALYAARQPDRVSHLMLWCTYARGSDYWMAEQSEGLRVLRQTDYRLFLRTAAHELIGWSDDGQSDAFATVMEDAVDRDRADELLAATRQWDISGVLSEISIPTLVLHRRGLNWIGVGLSRDLAAAVPGAQLVQLEGSSPLPAAGPIAPIVEAVARFLGVSAGGPSGRASGVRIVLFTDLVGHTEMIDRLGDEKGRAVLREHETISRGVFTEFGGTEVKALGDGFMTSFESVSGALDAAIALQRRIAARNQQSGANLISVRAGLNAGEPIQEQDDLFGTSVILASRIAGRAVGGQILVSNAVRELAAGKYFSFAAAERFVPKGFDAEIQVWELDWESETP